MGLDPVILTRIPSERESQRGLYLHCSDISETLLLMSIINIYQNPTSKRVVRGVRGGGLFQNEILYLRLALKIPCALKHAYVITYSNRVCMKYKTDTAIHFLIYLLASFIFVSTKM